MKVRNMNMLTSLDLLVILFMGLAFVSLLSLALMFLIKNKVVRYITMGLVLTAAAAAAFFDSPKSLVHICLHVCKRSA